ncbi:MAG TPA: HlyD family efflux transporter periplasmic adaptor subunit [Terriglobales bacterium]|nr:HlyD family efflux transporter periplasmic adaptor subunit [Terriglobales bacterium]
MTKKGKLIMLGAALCAAAVMGWYAYGGKLAVSAAPAQLGNLYDRFEETAEVRPKAEVFVFAPASGRISGLPDTGKAVAAGDVVCVITKDDAGAQSQILALEAQRLELTAAEKAAALGQEGAALSVEQAMRQAELADKAVSDLAALLEAGAATGAEYDEALRLSEDAHTALDAAQVAAVPAYPEGYFSAMRNIIDRQIALIDDTYGGPENASVTAPKDGILRISALENGQFVAKETPLFSIWSKDELKLVCSVLAEDAARIAVGDAVSIEFGGFEGSDGTVAAIAPEAATQLSSVGLSERRVDVTIAPAAFPEGAGVGYPADVAFSPLVAENVLTVPSSAVIPSGEGYAVYTVSGGRAHLTSVEVGSRAGGFAEIRSGLSEGDIVISDPYVDGLADRARVDLQ